MVSHSNALEIKTSASNLLDAFVQPRADKLRLYLFIDNVNIIRNQ